MRALTRRVLGLLVAALVIVAQTALAQSSIQYVYDELGRLISVTDPAGDTAVYHYDAVGNLLSIDRFSSSSVSIISFTPTSGAVGAAVIISGTGFSATPSQNTVTFNGSGASVTGASATQLTVLVPAGATTGPIAVTAPAGSASSASNFTVATAPGAPTITSFSPSAGTNGTPVTITGTNFDTTIANDRSSLNATLLSTSAATATQLSTAVPASGVTSGRLKVTTPYGTATSGSDLWVAPAGYGPANLEVKLRFNGFGDSNAATATLTSTSNVGLLLFDGAPAHRVSFKISGVTMTGTATLLSPYATQMVSAGVTSGGTFVEPVTLVSSGTDTYTLLVKPTGTGNATVAVYDVPADVTGSVVPTTAGATVSPVLGTPGQNARYSFAGASDTKVAVKVTNDTISNAKFSMLNPDGSTLASQVFTTSGGFIDGQMLATAGTYAIVVDPTAANTGSATLTVYDATDQTDTIAISTPGAEQPKTVSTSTPGQNVRLSFGGTANHRMSVKVGNGPAGWISILDRDGASALGSATIGATTTLVEPATLAADGTYTVLADYSGANTGSVTLTLYDVPADVTGTVTPTTAGASATADLSTPGQNALYGIGTPTNTRVSLLVGAGPLGAVRIRRPDGSTLVSGSITVVSTFIEPWTYESGQTIKVDPSGANAGSVTITAYDVPPDFSGTATIGGAATTVTTTVPGQNGSVTFAGNASQQVTVGMTNNHLGPSNLPGSVTVKLLSTDGQTVLASTTSSQASFNLSTVSLPAAGTYTISVDPAGTNKGTISVAVTSP